MAREYRMRKRADASDRTREKILAATMEMHDLQGVAPTTMAQIAARAGVGAATIYRHFPTLGDLVRACGGHVWQEMRPPVPDMAAAVFADVRTRSERLARLVEELDAFYTRGALRLGLAARDRELIPELHGFLSAVEAGVEALVRESLAGSEEPDATIRIIIALTSFPVWSALSRQISPPSDFRTVWTNLLGCALKSGRRE